MLYYTRDIKKFSIYKVNNVKVISFVGRTFTSSHSTFVADGVARNFRVQFTIMASQIAR